jgi:hypothetical protein
MFGKLAFFAFGFALGTRTGRDGMRQVASALRWAAGREEVRTVMGLAGTAAQAALERGQEYVARRPA